MQFPDAEHMGTSDHGGNNGRDFWTQSIWEPHHFFLTARAAGNGNFLCVGIAGTAHITS